jgi:signal transduction histidine kinase
MSVEAERDEALALLTGVRSYKLSYYSDYVHTARRLDRNIRALAVASRTLTSLSGGPAEVLSVAVVSAVEVFGGEWAAAAFEHSTVAQTPHLVVAEASGLVDPSLLSDSTRQVLEQVRELAPGRVEALSLSGRPTLIAPFVWQQQVCGWLVVALPLCREIENADRALLATLTNHIIAAAQSSFLLTRSEQLRAEAARSCDEALATAASLQAANAQLRRAHAALAEARQRELIETERERLARELHDSIAQRVLTIGMNAEWCRVNAGAPVVSERISEIKRLARETVAEIRSAIFNLSAADECIDDDIVIAIRRLARELRSWGVHVTVRHQGTPTILGLAVRRALVRCAREALFNALIHSGSPRVAVTLAFDPGRLCVTVRDQGSGDAAELRGHLHAATASQGDGYHRGLAYVDATLRQVGGALEIRNARRRGISIVATVPLDTP